MQQTCMHAKIYDELYLILFFPCRIFFGFIKFYLLLHNVILTYKIELIRPKVIPYVLWGPLVWLQINQSRPSIYIWLETLSKLWSPLMAIIRTEANIPYKLSVQISMLHPYNLWLMIFYYFFFLEIWLVGYEQASNGRKWRWDGGAGSESDVAEMLTWSYT